MPYPTRGTEDLLPWQHDYVKKRIGSAYRKRMHLRSLGDDLLIPYPRPDADDTLMPDFARWRLAKPKRKQKFGQPAESGTYFYFAPLTNGKRWADVCQDTSVDLYIVEGEFKAAALAQHGYCAIGVGGIWNWKQRDAHGNSGPCNDFDLIQWIGRRAIPVYDSDVRTKWRIQFALVGLVAELKRREAEVVVKLLPDLGDGKTGADDLIVAQGIKAFKALPELTLDAAFTDWELAKEPGCTDTGNAMRFVLQHGDHVRFVHEWKSWLLWDSVLWKRDAKEAVWDAARATVRHLYREALEHPDSTRRAELVRWAADSEGVKRIEYMLRAARNVHPVSIAAEDLDTHPMLLTVSNGVVDLRSGTLLPSEPDHLLTKQTAVAYSSNARCPLFEKFLLQITGDDIELVAYLQRFVGYLLTGETSEQCFFVFYGIGANGKSTLLRILVDLLGDFATTTRMETWAAQKRNAGGPSEDVARLHGARMVSAVESEDEQRLAESLIKELTGQDRVNARRLYEGSFEFVPQFKLVLVCNHKPAIRGDDPALWRRVRLLPFEQVFAPAQQDKQLVTKLRAELPGILNWAIRGCIEWQKTGLAEPKRILAATARYRTDSDLLRTFLDDRCLLSDGHSEQSSDLYAEYRGWCVENGHQPMSNTKLGNRLQDKGLTRRRKKRGTVYVGLRLKKHIARSEAPK